jgi:DNA-binding CsgD family transcriptional regulator
MLHPRLIVIFALITVVFTGLMLVDLAEEPAPLNWAEVAIDAIEKVILIGAMAVVAWTVHSLRDLQDGQTALSNNLARAVAQGESWRVERRGEIEALSRAIADQLRKWQLTEAEIDIAGLMLKGATLKEIALARDTSEATVRQQAQAIYRKSGLSGRTELSAYFLESLFETAEDTARQRAKLTVVGGPKRGA